MGLASKVREAEKHEQQQMQQQPSYTTVVPSAPLEPAYVPSQYVQQPPLMTTFASSSSSSAIEREVEQKIRKCIAANGFAALYPEHRIQETLARLRLVNWQQKASQWKVPLELVTDFAMLALYDIALYADDSGSMTRDDRVDDLKMIIRMVSDICTAFDDDGIIVRFINSSAEGNGISTAGDVEQLISKVDFSGGTMIGTQLERKLIQPFASTKQMKKPILILTITDGEPNGEPRDKLQHVIENSVRQTMSNGFGPKAVAFAFVQVGRDGAAERYLDELDNLSTRVNGFEVGKTVDCTSYYEQEEEQFKRKGVSLNQGLYLLKMLLGAVDESYDDMD
jgi:hypothetical protein